MNNYISKENAIGLKEIGFDGAVNACYAEWVKEDVVKVNPAPSNWNQYCDACSAPDFLTAADWLADTHRIWINLYRNTTGVRVESNPYLSESFADADHRNAAIKHAILIVKERREKGGANG